MIKIIVLLASLLTIRAALSEFQVRELVDSIYIIEGGSLARHPYGVESIETRGNITFARKICRNSVLNNYSRWLAAKKPEDFICFMSKRYCPLNHKVWAENLHYFVRFEIK